MIEAFSTDTLPPAQRTEYWSEAVRKSFAHLEVRPRKETEMHGVLRRACIAGVQAGFLEASPQRLARTARLIAADGDNSLIVGLQRTGGTVATQDGRVAPVAMEEFVILDNRRPYVLDFVGPVRQHVATVPREMLNLPDSALRLVTGRTYSRGHPIGRILASFVDGLVTTTDHCICAANPKRFLKQGIVDVLTALAASAGDIGQDPAPVLEVALLLRLRTYIRTHLDDPALSPASVAATHHISVRYLHKLFEDEPMTIGRWIQHLRLEACRRDLVRPELTGLTVAAIAHRWGFVSHAHFSRTFRSLYGVSPVEWRQAGALQAAALKATDPLAPHEPGR
ncbi:helix-turn-helix domain-containing protein [Streptomyces sp. NPDC058691]|uniref:helix-turn-helix domain-containing protein n=1 Tax=Streptomyces sp. NPDC058691 TaxID=3346601 RepID=UPI003657B558